MDSTWVVCKRRLKCNQNSSSRFTWIILDFDLSCNCCLNTPQGRRRFKRRGLLSRILLKGYRSSSVWLDRLGAMSCVLHLGWNHIARKLLHLRDSPVLHNLPHQPASQLARIKQDRLTLSPHDYFLPNHWRGKSRLSLPLFTSLQENPGSSSCSQFYIWFSELLIKGTGVCAAFLSWCYAAEGLLINGALPPSQDISIANYSSEWFQQANMECLFIFDLTRFPRRSLEEPIERN